MMTCCAFLFWALLPTLLVTALGFFMFPGLLLDVLAASLYLATMPLATLYIKVLAAKRDRDIDANNPTVRTKRHRR